MTWKQFTLAFVLGICVFSIFSIPQKTPGYMDAEYYYGMGLRIARDGTLSEPFLWNYLHTDKTVPHPGFTYWKPLPSFIAAAGIALTGLENFYGARIGSILLAGFIPLITMCIAYQLSDNKTLSYLAAGFSIFPVFYLPYMGTTDSFSLLMVLGGLYFLVLKNKKIKLRYLMIGVISGLFHLTRAEGLIWLLTSACIAFIAKESRSKKVGLVLTGYLLVMGPWFARNYLSIGSILPAGTTQTLWLTNYNQLFSYSEGLLTFQNWIGQGVSAIIKNIAHAFVQNIKTLAVVQGQVILAPLIIIGIWKFRKEPVVKSLLLTYFLIFFLMTVVFPFAGSRGGFFHAGAAHQPLFWALGSIGFSVLMDLGVQKRSWQPNKANLIFGSTLVVVLFSAAVYVYRDRVVGESTNDLLWNQSSKVTKKIGRELDVMGVAEDDLIMINNPPGLYAATGFSSVVIPDGGVETMIAAAEYFQVNYIVLEKNHPQGLDDLYLDPYNDPRLEVISTQDGVHIFYLE